MADSRRATRFGDLLDGPVRNGLYKPKEYHGQGVKIVNMGELFAHGRLRSVPMKRLEVTESEASRFLLSEGDLIFARRSLTAEGAGKCSIVLEADEPTVFESSIIRARLNRRVAEPLFLYYVFSSPAGLHALGTIRRQVAVAGITGSDLTELEIPVVPPLVEQRRIAHILGTLDDKIELNRRMNETLEEMARTLFKSWFVDFDPVRAKAAGRDPGLPAHLADVFPDRLVDSELGEIPEGWEVHPLGDLLDLAYGKPLKAATRRHGPFPVMGANGRIGSHDVPLVNGPGIVVGRKGTPGVVTWVAGDFFPIDTTFHVRLKMEGIPMRFLFHALRAQQLSGLSADSAVPGLNRSAVYSRRQVVPARQAVRAFEAISALLHQRAETAMRQSTALGGTRDRLLPKLLRALPTPHADVA